MAAIERRSDPENSLDLGLTAVLLSMIGLLISIPTMRCGEYVTVHSPASITVVSCEIANIGLEPSSYSSVIDGILVVEITEVERWQRKYDVCSVLNYDDESITALEVSWTGNLSIVIDRVDLTPSNIGSRHSSTVRLFTNGDAGFGIYVGDILLSFQDDQGSEMVEILISVNMVLTG